MAAEFVLSAQNEFQLSEHIVVMIVLESLYNISQVIKFRALGLPILKAVRVLQALIIFWVFDPRNLALSRVQCIA